jgi:quercetin dioxygenase-like cupin family protein
MKREPERKNLSPIGMATSWRAPQTVVGLAAWLLAISACGSASMQTAGTAPSNLPPGGRPIEKNVAPPAEAHLESSAPPRGPPQHCIPVSERNGELGCFILADSSVGELPQLPLYWHLTTYPTRDAAQAAKGPRGTVVESLGKVWLLTIAETEWHAPSGGESVAKIGPLPVPSGKSFSAHYMEAVMLPGAESGVHRHPGPEAFYNLSGEVCLETPAGKSVGRTGGEAVVIPAGAPMRLSVVGTEKRRSLVLVLHESSTPWMTPAPDWTPQGLCKNTEPTPARVAKVGGAL